MKSIKLTKKQSVIIMSGLLLISLTVAAVVAVSKKQNIVDITVTQNEIDEYKKMIGNSMDIKKTVFILFDTQEEARKFIDEHGGDENPEKTGIGSVAHMPDGYYNIVGKEKLESIFDGMADGEYTKEPIEYSGVFCYMKRLGIGKVNDDDISEVIRQEKMNKVKK